MADLTVFDFDIGMTEDEKRKVEEYSKSNFVIPHLRIGPWKIDKSGWYFQGSGKDDDKL